jgi:hypothetical protein
MAGDDLRIEACGVRCSLDDRRNRLVREPGRTKLAMTVDRPEQRPVVDA